MRQLKNILSLALEMALALCLLAISTIVVTLVVLRYLFNSSITGANETVTILFVYTTVLGAAVAIGKREHIAIPFAVESLPPRVQRLVEFVGLILVAALNAVMLCYSIGWIRITGAYVMPSTGLPRWAVQISVPIGCGLAIAFCLLRLIAPNATEHPSAEPDAPNDQLRRSDE